MNRMVSNMLLDTTLAIQCDNLIELSVFSRHYLPDAALTGATPRLCCRSMLLHSSADPFAPHLCDTSRNYVHV